MKYFDRGCLCIFIQAFFFPTIFLVKFLEFYVFQEIHEGLDFSAADDEGYSFGIFSVKFSTDGRELVAGSSDDSIYVYDLEANKLSLRIEAHSVGSLSLYS